ncbi:MAG: hypothetical protein R2694_12020 [Ilumatobacteraceae bacterium]
MQWAIERGEQQLRSTGRSLPLYLRVDAFDHGVRTACCVAGHGGRAATTMN